MTQNEQNFFGQGKTYLVTSTEGCTTVGAGCVAVDSDSTTGTYGPAAVNGFAQGTDNTNRFSFTIPLSSLPGVAVNTKLTSTATIAGSTSEFSGVTTVTSTKPVISLVKRITAINGTPVTGFNGSAADPNSNGDTSEDVNWASDVNTYLRGKTDDVLKPGSEVEYTIYFLNSQNSASSVSVCDLVPEHLTFMNTGYDSISPRPMESGALSASTGIAVALYPSSLGTLPNPPIPTAYLTNESDGDRGRFYAPNDPSTPSICKKFDNGGNEVSSGAVANTNGAVVVNLVKPTDPDNSLPPATAKGTPPRAYGFIRFKARIN